MRAVSTVLDVSLFLLLVGAAVATIALAPARPGAPPVAERDPADEIAETLATSTARVNYSIGPALDRRGPGEIAAPDGPIYARSDHGTYAGLLAEATVANATIDGEHLTIGGRPFATAVRTTTDGAVRRRGVGRSIRATWKPYPEAALGGGVTVGEAPPRDVDVRTATVVLDSGLSLARPTAVDAARQGGFAGLARKLADAAVAGLFPARETRVAARGDYPTATVTRARYRAAGQALGVDAVDVTDGEVRPATVTLRSALEDRLEADLRSRYDEPTAAARDVRIGEVTVVVRTWSR
jgi:hypothetical protein